VWSSNSEITATGGGLFDGVSCSSAGNCTAIGNDNNGSNGEPIYATETAGVWSSATEIPATGGGLFTGVSCTDANDCTAVGLDYDPNWELVYATETAGVWGSITEIPTTGGGHFSGVSCVSIGNCTAVGTDINSGGNPVYVTETAGVWGSATELTAIDGGIFTGVSCSDATDCTASGYDYNGNSEPMYATESAGVWGSVTEITAIGFGQFYGVTCVSAGNCIAAGQDASEPIYATESAGAWGSATEIAATNGASFNGVSCVSAWSCTAIGGDSNGIGEPIYATSQSQSAAGQALMRVGSSTGPDVQVGDTLTQSVTVTGAGITCTGGTLSEQVVANPAQGDSASLQSTGIDFGNCDGPTASAASAGSISIADSGPTNDPYVASVTSVAYSIYSPGLGGSCTYGLALALGDWSSADGSMVLAGQANAVPGSGSLCGEVSTIDNTFTFGPATDTSQGGLPVVGGPALSSQAITFTSTQPSGVTVGNPPYVPTATGGASTSPLVLSLDGSSTGCTLTSGVVSFPAVGTCVIDANQAGDANYTAAPQVQQSITVNSTVPGSPTGVVATPGNGQVTLSFTAPADGGSPITQYIVGWNDVTTNPTYNPAGFANQAFPGGSSPLTITGLNNGDTYAFMVSATNANGNGVGASATATASSTVAHFTSGATGTTSSTTITNLAITATATTAPTRTSTSWLSASGLPTGVTFASNTGTKAGTGTLTATHLASGVYTITLKASNATGVLTVQTYTLTSLGFLTSPSSQTWTAGTPASVTATTNDAGATVTSSALPAGMTLTSSGGNATIHGTPTTGAAAKSITLTAKDGTKSTTSTFTVSVNRVPTVAVSGTTTLKDTQAFSLTVKTTGTPAATVSTVGLPAQLNYSSSTGKITGTITMAGSYTFTVDASNAAGTATTSVTVTVTRGPVLRTGSATGPAVAVHDVLTEGVTFSDNHGAIDCTGTATETVGSNPNAPGTVSLTMTSLPLDSCTDFVTSASLVAPSTFTIGDSQGPPIDPAKIPSFAVSGSAPLGPVHGTTTSAGFTGTWSNTNNSVTFTNQTMNTTSLQYGNAPDTVTATFGPFTDSSVAGSPLVFVN
jgi:hypothetical protein